MSEAELPPRFVSNAALVSSSSALLGSGLGSDVDAHGAVVRLNEAPTHGYEGDVGSRGTVRVLSPPLAPPREC